jgi:hypothetical protein
MSIYNNIRSSKTSVGAAPMYQGMRTFDQSAQVCPVRANVSDYGVVGVSRDTIQSYSAGCFDPLDRMTVENIQRPRYSTYLNAGAISAPGVGDDNMPMADPEYQNKPNYDTQLGYTYMRPVLPYEQVYPQYSAQNAQFATQEALNNCQFDEQNFVSGFFDHKYENRQVNSTGGYPFKNGC